jgi:hypothetical protein
LFEVSAIIRPLQQRETAETHTRDISSLCYDFVLHSGDKTWILPVAEAKPTVPRPLEVKGLGGPKIGGGGGKGVWERERTGKESHSVQTMNITSQWQYFVSQFLCW